MRRRVLPFLAVVAVMAFVAACGGGGVASDFELPPFWIQTDIAAGDFDGDGRVDVASVATLATPPLKLQGYLRIYRQTSPGAFAFSQYLVGNYPWRVAIADIDGDAAPDLLVLDANGPNGDLGCPDKPAMAASSFSRRSSRRLLLLSCTGGMGSPGRVIPSSIIVRYLASPRAAIAAI